MRIPSISTSLEEGELKIGSSSTIIRYMLIPFISYFSEKYPKIKIVNQKCNKLDIIKVIQDLIKIEDQAIFTIGDDINDIEMILRYHGFSLTTAKKEVKDIAEKIYEELNQLIDDIDKKQE